MKLSRQARITALPRADKLGEEVHSVGCSSESLHVGACDDTWRLCMALLTVWATAGSILKNLLLGAKQTMHGYLSCLCASLGWRGL